MTREREACGAWAEFFFKLPQWLYHDVRARTLPGDARLALYHLGAVHGGQVPLGDLCAREALDALEPGAGDSADRALALGLIAVQRGALVLLLPPRVVAEPANEVHRAVETAPSPAEATDVPPPTTTTRTTEESRRRAAEKRLRFDHRHRRGPCVDMPEGMSWEVWLATPAGEAAWRRRVLGELPDRPRSVRGTYARNPFTPPPGTTEPNHGTPEPPSHGTTEPDHGTEEPRNHGTVPPNHGTTTEPIPLTSSEPSSFLGEERQTVQTHTSEPEPGTVPPNHGTEPRNRTTERSEASARGTTEPIRGIEPRVEDSEGERVASAPAGGGEKGGVRVEEGTKSRRFERDRLLFEEDLGIDPALIVTTLRTRCGKVLKCHGASDSRVLELLKPRVKELAVRDHDPVTTLEPYEYLGDWIAAGGLGWWTQGRPTFDYLLRPGKLAEHIEDAAQWHRTGRPAIRHESRAPGPQKARAPRRGPAPVSPEFAPVDDPEAYEIWKLEYQKAMGQ